MCEFTVFLNEVKILEDVVLAIIDGPDVVIKDIMGGSKRLSNAKIVEVNVMTAKLHLMS